MGKWQYTKGLHDLGNNTYAYLQPDGSWGWSNAGLIVDGDQSLLVDKPVVSTSTTNARLTVPPCESFNLSGKRRRRSNRQSDRSARTLALSSSCSSIPNTLCWFIAISYAS